MNEVRIGQLSKKCKAFFKLSNEIVLYWEIYNKLKQFPLQKLSDQKDNLFEQIKTLEKIYNKILKKWSPHFSQIL